MTMILGNSDINSKSVIEKSKKSSPHKGDANSALNFGNVAMQVSFNDGGTEGYYKVRPKALRPSKHNPRPDWNINDDWLVKHVGIDMEDIFESNLSSRCLIKIEEKQIDGEYKEIITFPAYQDLLHHPDPAQQKEYDFLVSLAKSIRETGQIQPIEIESDSETNTLVVLEGHLRRLACILGHIPYIKAIRNEGLHELSKRDKIGRQITENSLRSNITPFGNYQLAIAEVKENPNITVRDLRERLKIKTEFASVLLKMASSPEKYHPLVLDLLKKAVLSANNLIKVAAISRIDRQEIFLNKMCKKHHIETTFFNENPKPRGMDGRKKSVATMQIKTQEHCVKAGKKLLDLIPQLKSISSIEQVNSVEDLAILLKSFEKFLLD